LAYAEPTRVSLPPIKPKPKPPKVVADDTSFDAPFIFFSRVTTKRPGAELRLITKANPVAARRPFQIQGWIDFVADSK